MGKAVAFRLEPLTNHQLRLWLWLISFQDLADGVFAVSSNLCSHGDDELDETELQVCLIRRSHGPYLSFHASRVFTSVLVVAGASLLNVTQVALDVLHEKLNELAHGHLPEPAGNVPSLMKKFDQDKSGTISKEEFRRFAQVYFGRLKWPLWKTAVKGVAIGVGAFFACQFVVNPILGRLFGVAMRRFVRTGARLASKVVTETLHGNFSSMVDDIKLSFSDGNPFFVSEAEEEDWVRKERRERFRARLNYAKNLAAAGAAGGSCAVVGLV